MGSQTSLQSIPALSLPTPCVALGKLTNHPRPQVPYNVVVGIKHVYVKGIRQSRYTHFIKRVNAFCRGKELPAQSY